MFRLVQEALGSGQAVLPGSLGQELSSPHHVRLVTKVLMNYTSDGGIVNLQLPGECPHGLSRILIDDSLDRTDEFRRPDDVRAMTMSFSVGNGGHITPSSSQFSPNFEDE